MIYILERGLHMNKYEIFFMTLRKAVKKNLLYIVGGTALSGLALYALTKNQER